MDDELVTLLGTELVKVGARLRKMRKERGELAPDTDVELALDLLAGPLLMRGLLTGEPFGEDYARRLVDAVLRAIHFGRGA
jgi:hypothetical protein